MDIQPKCAIFDFDCAFIPDYIIEIEFMLTKYSSRALLGCSLKCNAIYTFAHIKIETVLHKTDEERNCSAVCFTVLTAEGNFIDR